VPLVSLIVPTSSVKSRIKRGLTKVWGPSAGVPKA